MNKNNKPLPTLTRRRLTASLREMMPDFPTEILSSAGQLILTTMSSALAESRPITLRGFGSFQVRRYKDSTKKVGLIFRASPELFRRINKGGEVKVDAVKAAPEAAPVKASSAPPKAGPKKPRKKAAPPKSNEGYLFPLWDDEND
ncbi:hypothetical protein LJB99_03905 [Deltaproteobacteria bacterium OttesenSCG-928-K17]|nr:hypothetical protein [Deltaproteobacteria bacterium OttesenSCG-928-K17]